MEESKNGRPMIEEALKELDKVLSACFINLLSAFSIFVSIIYI